jgi:hypothetical protein
MVTQTWGLVGNEGKIPFGRPRRGWEDTLKMDHQEIGWMLWTGLIWLGTRAVGGIL